MLQGQFPELLNPFSAGRSGLVMSLLKLACGCIQPDLRHHVLSFGDVKFYYGSYEIFF